MPQSRVINKLHFSPIRYWKFDLLCFSLNVNGLKIDAVEPPRKFKIYISSFIFMCFGLSTESWMLHSFGSKRHWDTSKDKKQIYDKSFWRILCFLPYGYWKDVNQLYATQKAMIIKAKKSNSINEHIGPILHRDYGGTRIYNHLVLTRTFNNLAIISNSKFQIFQLIIKRW